MHGRGHASRGGACVEGRMCVRCMAGGMHGRGHAWQGACMAGGHAWGACVVGAYMAVRGYVWQRGSCVAEGGMHGGGVHGRVCA